MTRVSPSMFKRAHHQIIANVLLSLDAELLKQHHCFFGGGTAITLLFGEYRESVDVDFMVSDEQSFRALRNLAKENFAQFFAVQKGALGNSDIRVDQYGIRTRLSAANVTVKFEIIREARIQLKPSGVNDLIGKVATLSPLDLVTTKLLAKSDRWADAGVFSRDIIDLAMMQPSPTLLREGLQKAQAAYGESVRRDLDKAIARLKDDPAILDRCIEVLAIDIPKALLWQNIKKLGRT